MTLKTSFFNKGIYKSTLKRYTWGSILYFVILFMATGLSVFLNAGKGYEVNIAGYYKDNPMILQDGYITLPILAAIIVPSIVALLVFRFIHSKKQAIFIHSIPVSRKANFISSVAAAFTLMLVPVIANGVILILISLCGHGKYFTVLSCFIWMEYNAFGIFLMFSCAVFAASITGNGFAMLAINVLIHVFLFVIVSSLNIMAEIFIYGFTQVNTVYELIAENNFAYVTFGHIDRYFHQDISCFDYIKFAVAAFILYVTSYFLYKNRKIESASDVSGFKCLNSIFKYLVTFLVTMFGFAVFSKYINENHVVFWIIITIISIIAYTASEMVLKKTLNVLYSWKGYVGFAVVFAALTLLFSQTSFFGYETRIPKKADIAEASIYNYYYCEDEPYTADTEVIDMITAAHADFVKNKTIPRIKPDNNYYSYKDTRIHIKYKLKSGKILERVYPVTVDECTGIMDEFYENTAYKKISEQVFMDDSRITRIFANYDDNPVNNHKELLDALRTDYMTLSYSDIYHYENNPQKYDNISQPYIVRIEYMVNYEENKSNARISEYHINVTDKFKNTVKWLKENGYEKIN